MGYTCKNGPHLLKWGTVGTIGHNCESESYLQNGSHLQNWVKVEKMGHTWRNKSNFQNGAQLEKWVTLRKWVIIAKMGYTC